MLWGLSPHSLRGDPGHCSTLPPRFADSGNQGSGNPGFREPGFGARFREPKIPRTRVWARFREQTPEHQFWNILETQSLGNQGSGKVLATFRQGSGNHRGCGSRIRIYTLDYAIGSGQGQDCEATNQNRQRDKHEKEGRPTPFDE